MSWLMQTDGEIYNKRYKRIWNGPAPLSNGNDNPKRPLPNQHHPSLEVYLPDNSLKRAAVIVLPGGGYHYLANHESVPPAEWLQENGFAAFVLRYRLGPEYSHPVQVTTTSKIIAHGCSKSN